LFVWVKRKGLFGVFFVIVWIVKQECHGQRRSTGDSFLDCRKWEKEIGEEFLAILSRLEIQLRLLVMLRSIFSATVT
jgi:hypothetical protein